MFKLVILFSKRWKSLRFYSKIMGVVRRKFDESSRIILDDKVIIKEEVLAKSNKKR